MAITPAPMTPERAAKHEMFRLLKSCNWQEALCALHGLLELLAALDPRGEPQTGDCKVCRGSNGKHSSLCGELYK